MAEPTIGPACERGGEIVDYTIGLCSCGECPTPRPDSGAAEAYERAQQARVLVECRHGYDACPICDVLRVGEDGG